MSKDWVAYIEKGWLLWGWTVQRSDEYMMDPKSGLPDRGDVLHGIALTQASARRKARRWLRNRIERDRPRPDGRIVVTLDSDD